MIYKPLTNNSTPLIIEDIREYLKEDLPSQVKIDTGDLAHLIGEIERLKKGYCELKEKCNKGECDCTHEEYNGMCEQNIKMDLEIERLNSIIKYTDSWIDRTIETIKQQPSEDDTWILERLNGIKQCLLQGSDKE